MTLYRSSQRFDLWEITCCGGFHAGGDLERQGGGVGDCRWMHEHGASRLAHLAVLVVASLALLGCVAAQSASAEVGATAESGVTEGSSGPERLPAARREISSTPS